MLELTLDVNHDVLIAPIQIFLILLDIIDYSKTNYLAHNLEEFCPSVLKSSNRRKLQNSGMTYLKIAKFWNDQSIYIDKMFPL